MRLYLAKLTTGALLVCGLALSDGAAAAAADAQPVWPMPDWSTSTPEEQGLASGELARLVETVGSRAQDSLLITRHGRLVLEAFYAPYGSGIRHDLRSVTKSITSTLTAIEVQQGILDGVDRPVLELFADLSLTNVDERKKALTLQHLLDMTSGFEWREKNYTPDETLSQMYKAPDRVRFVLERPMTEAPGTSFYYNSGNPYVLSAVITRKTGVNALAFARRELFGPLDISDVDWGKADAQNVIDGEAGLYMHPRDMAKIGYLYLRGGVWQGRRLIPAAWVGRAQAGPIPATFGLHYANLWWSLPELGAYMALGLHSQVILVLPKLDIVAVMTGLMRKDEYYPLDRLVRDIGAAVRSDSALPPDPIGQSLLAAAIRMAATERPSATGPIPAQAQAISGKTYQFADNILHARSVTMNFTRRRASFAIVTDPEKADRPVERFVWTVALDGRFQRSTPAPYGIDVAKGRWTSGRSFELERRILGHSETQLWTIVFDGTAIDATLVNTDGFTAKLHGEQSQR